MDDPNRNHKNEPLREVSVEVLWQANLNDIQTYFLSDVARRVCWGYAMMKTEAPPVRINTTNHIHDGRHRVIAARLRGESVIKAYVSVV